MSLVGNNSKVGHSSGGRKRKQNHTSSNHRKQAKLHFRSENHSPPAPPKSPFSSEMAEDGGSVSGSPDTNNKVSIANSFAVKTTMNNHTKKPGTKKIVIKNRKGILECMLCVDS